MQDQSAFTIRERSFARRHAVGMLAATAAAFTLLYGAGAQADMKAIEAAARKEGPMTWYISFYGQNPADQTAAAFAKAYPGLQVIPIRTTTGAAFQRLQQDFKNNVAVASVASLSGIGGYYDILMREQRLAAYTPEAAAKLIPEAKQAIVKDHIYPIGAALMVIGYNNQKVQGADVPKTWKDLADPKWKGKLGLAHPSFSGFDAAWVVTMNKAVGWGYFEALGKNQPLVQRSTFDTITALNSGERLVGTMPDTVAKESIGKGNPIGIAYPSDGAVMIMGFTAILKNAPQPNMAKLFTEFLLGVEHAKVVSGTHHQSMRPEVSTQLEGGKSLKDLKIAPMVESSEAEKELPKLIEKWRDTFGQ